MASLPPPPSFKQPKGDVDEIVSEVFDEVKHAARRVRYKLTYFIYVHVAVCLCINITCTYASLPCLFSD